MSTTYLFLAVVLLLSEHHASALTCYQCGPGTDGCGVSSFNPKGNGVTKVTSSASGVSCGKYVYSSNSNAGGRNSPSLCTAGTVAGTSLLDEFTVYCCTTDLCNGNSMKSASILLSVATAALAIYYKK